MRCDKGQSSFEPCVTRMNESCQCVAVSHVSVLQLIKQSHACAADKG